MSRRWDYRAFVRAHRIGKRHEWRRVRPFEKFADSFFSDGRCERTEYLAVFNAAIQNFLHLGSARVRQDAAIAQRAGSPLRRTLKPADDFSGGDMPRAFIDQRSLIERCYFDAFGSGNTINGFPNFRR